MATTTMTEALPAPVVPSPHLVAHSTSFQPLLPSRSNVIPDRIAFGSCNDQDRQNKLWPIIQARNPAAFVWGGDAIYAGTRDNAGGIRTSPMYSDFL